MRFIRTLTIHFFTTRHLKKLNKQLELKFNAGDVRLLFYLHQFGPLPYRDFSNMCSWKLLKQSIIPKLRDAGFIELKDRKYNATFEGMVYLKRYADMLATARMDRINLKKPKKRKTVFRTE